MTSRVIVWPTTGAPAITFRGVDDVVIDAAPTPAVERLVRTALAAGRRVLVVNPANVVGVVCEPESAGADGEA